MKKEGKILMLEVQKKTSMYRNLKKIQEIQKLEKIQKKIDTDCHSPSFLCISASRPIQPIVMSICPSVKCLCHRPGPGTAVNGYFCLKECMAKHKKIFYSGLDNFVDFK